MVDMNMTNEGGCLTVTFVGALDAITSVDADGKKGLELKIKEAIAKPLSSCAAETAPPHEATSLGGGGVSPALGCQGFAIASKD